MKRFKIYTLLSLVIVLLGMVFLSSSRTVKSVEACETPGCHCDTRSNETWQHQDWVNTTYKCPSSDSAYTYSSKGDRTCSREIGSGHSKCTKWAYKVVDVAGHWGSVESGKCPDHSHDDECKQTKVGSSTQYRFNDSGEWKNGSCPSPVDGQVLEWSACSKTCGGGKQTAVRVSDPKNCGKPVSVRERSCNTQACEVEPTPTPTVPPEVTPTPTVPPEVTPTPAPETTPGPTVPPGPQPCNGCGGWPSAPTCGATKPGTPTLLSVVRKGTTAVLSWTAVVPVTHYAIVYGTKPGEYIYGATNVGNTTTYTVGSLDPGTKYYFAVRGVNDCMPSEMSASDGQVLGLGIGGGQVLGLASTGDSSLIYLLLLAGCATLTLSLASFRFAKLEA